jgi:phospholipid/cholesterol/gamma-HCH transport system ATP-binding protein
MAEEVRQIEDKPIIEVEGFRAAYGGRTVLENLTFHIRRGEIFILGGGSGCGKSTVLKHLIGLYKPAAGRMLIDGQDINASTGEARQAILRKFGVAFQSGALFGNMTVLQNVRLPMEEYTDLTDDQMDMIALTKLRLVDLEQAAQKLPSELSGGMQKRAAIARAMALDPAIVFLDEPSAGLDPITSADLDELLIDLNRMLKMTFVVVTHELPSIFRIADRVLVLDAHVKTMVGLDSPAVLRDSSPNPWIRQFFNRTPDGAQVPEPKSPEQQMRSHS